jgi:hypothetical protein
MKRATHALLTAIDRDLHADHLPTSTEHVPSELQDLIAQLVALEAARRESNASSVEVLQASLAPPVEQSS